jgi:hypothetical protein
MMLPCWPLVLAQVTSSAPRPGDWRFGWAGVGLVAAGALGIILFAWLVMRWLARRQRQISHSPWSLFRDLATAHGLTHRERQLLARVAQHFRLEQPATLFVEPAWWEHDRLGPSWKRRLPQLEKLRRRLFAAR